VEGRAEGIFEAKIAMARELKKQGIPLATIQHVTALSQKELEEL
jgi:hypothetical protein